MRNKSNDGIAFTTVTEEKATNKNYMKKEVTCFNCRRQGINPMSAWRNCLQQKKKCTSLLINKEDSSDIRRKRKHDFRGKPK